MTIRVIVGSRMDSLKRRVTTFAELGLSESTLETLTHLGYATPTPIQDQAIPRSCRART